MSRTVCLIVVLLCAATTGCAGSKQGAASVQPSSASASVATEAAPATAAPEPEPVPDPKTSNEGLPIKDLADKGKSNADRVALLAVAHKSAGVSDKQFYVWQLLQQGSTAVGDLQGSSSGKRRLVVFEKQGDDWKVLSSTQFLDASESELKKTTPAVTPALAEKVEFVVPVKVDSFFAKNTGTIDDMSGGNTRMYAPTRLPEGLKMSDTSADGSISAEYRDGSKRLTYFAWISGDYGDGETPDETYTDLRFGGKGASMDPAFYYRTDSKKKGPFLTAESRNQVVCGIGVSPGMVAAVAESMVKVP